MLRNRLFWVGVSAVLVSCGGSKGAPPDTAETAGADESTMSSDQSVSEEGASEASAKPETAASEPAEADAETGAEADAEGEEGAAEHTVPTEAAPPPQGGPPPSDDLQSYVGAKTYTPEYRTVTENMDSIKQCYLDAMRGTPELQGTIKVRFTVNKKGKVIKITAPVNELNDQVEQCIFAAIKKMKFPKRADKRTVEYPFKFIPAP